MKNSVLIYLNLVIVILSLLSCTNNEPIINTHKTTQSVAIQTAMNELQNHFDTNGMLKSSNNPTGNILFDYCFNFEFPINLSYNTSTSVTVNDFIGLADIVTNMTDTHYIDGIVFPFNVTVFDQDTNAIIVQTITDENSFEELIDTCNFDDVASECNCNQEFNPICIELNDVNGESFSLQFPNKCVAGCKGFSQENFVTCDDVINPRFNNINCFKFIYPISIENYNENTITLSSNSDLEMITYTITGSFNFIYPFSIELENTTIETISNEQQFIELLNNCYNSISCECESNFNPICIENDGILIEYTNMCFAECDGFTQANFVNCNPSGDCTIEDLTVEIEDCNYDGTFNIILDFETNQPEDYVFLINFEAYNSTDVVFPVSELPITLYNIEYLSQETTFEVYFSNLCLENVSFDTPTCEDYGCWSLTFPATIIAEDTPYIVNTQSELNTIIDTYSTSNLTIEYPFEVEFDGFQVTVEDESIYYKIGKWDNMCD